MKNNLIARARYPNYCRKRTWAEQRCQGEQVAKQPTSQSALSSLPAAGEQLACKMQACCVAVVWRAPKALCS